MVRGTKTGNGLTDDQIELIDTLRSNPAVAAKVLLGADLFWYQIEAIEDFFCNKKRFALLKWSRQLGKCQCTDSKVFTRFTSCNTLMYYYLKVGDFSKKMADGGYDKVEIITFDQEGMKFEWTDNFTITSNGIKKCYKVKTASGRSTSLTINHPLLKIDGWKELGSIKSGDKIAVPRTLPYNSDIDIITDPEVRVLAYMIGDGCVASYEKYQKFTLTKTIHKIIQEWGIDCKEIFGDSIEIKQIKDTPSWYLTGVKKYDVISWLEKFDIKGKLSYDKRVPGQIFGTSKRQISLFLNRLFSTDGWACLNYHKVCETDSKERYSGAIGYCSVNEGLIKDVQHLLLRFGIISHYRRKPVDYIRKNGEQSIAYQLHIGDSRSIIKFCNEIGMYGKSEALAKVEELAYSKENSNNKDVIPVEIWEYISKKVNEKLQIEKQKQKKWLKETGNKIARDQKVSLRKWDREGAIRRKELTSQYSCAPQRDKVLRYAEFLDDDYLRFLATSDLYWDEVVFVEYDGEHETFDLAVPGPDNGGIDGNYRNFISDDILVHNTYLEAIMIALQCLLYPDEVGIFLAPSQRQSLNPMNTLSRYYNTSEIFRGLIEKKTKGIIRFKNGSEILSLPMGDGCVSDCYITTCSGICKLDDIVGNKVSEKSQIKTNDRVNGSNGFNDVDYYFYNGYVDTKKVKTNCSFQLEGSLIHPIKAVRDNVVDWVRYNDLKVGDKVLIDRTEDWFPKCNDLRYDDAYAIGALIGDGSYTILSSIGFSNNKEDNDIAKYINESSLFSSLGFEFKRKKNDTNHMYLCGKEKELNVNVFFDYFGMDYKVVEGRLTKNKSFPSKVLGCSKDAMVGFIQGLFDTDGSVCKSEHEDSGLWLEFTNTSYELVRVLQIILLKFGIISNVRDRKRDEKWERCYDLFITGTNVKKFSNRIGFRLDRKQKRLEKLLLEKKRDWDIKDLVPHAPYLVLELVNKVRIISGTKYVGGAVKLRLHKVREKFKNGIGLTYLHIERILDFFKEYSNLDEYNNLKDVYDKNYFYDEIVDIKDDKADTYDAYIPYDHTFWSNGFISHNSKILGSHATIIGIDEYARFTQNYITTVILPMLNQPGANGLPNKLITLSTPLSKQNHFYQWYLTHKKYFGKENSLYHLSEYDYRDSRTIDLDIIQIQYENSTWEQFARENLGIFTDNIDGYFPNDLIYSCDEEEEGSIKVQVTPDNPDKRYVLGVDPSNMVMQDRFALYLFEVEEFTEKGMGLKFANGWTFDNKRIPEVENLMRRVMRVFPVIRCQIDAGGGGRQIAEHLMEPLEYFDEILNETMQWTGCKNAEISDKTPQSGGNETPIRIIAYSSEKKNRMFFNLKNLMTKGIFKLPKTNYYDKSFVEANLLKDELENITTRTLPNNLLAFDHPENVGDDRANATALAVDGLWDVFYGQVESSANIVRGVGNRRPAVIFGDFGKPREFNYKQRNFLI